MTPKMNFCAMFSTVIYKSFNIKMIICALKELANSDGNNKDNDNHSCSVLFFAGYFLSVYMIIS